MLFINVFLLLKFSAKCFICCRQPSQNIINITITNQKHFDGSKKFNDFLDLDSLPSNFQHPTTSVGHLYNLLNTILNRYAKQQKFSKNMLVANLTF